MSCQGGRVPATANATPLTKTTARTANAGSEPFRVSWSLASSLGRKSLKLHGRNGMSGYVAADTDTAQFLDSQKA